MRKVIMTSQWHALREFCFRRYAKPTLIQRFLLMGSAVVPSYVKPGPAIPFIWLSLLPAPSA